MGRWLSEDAAAVVYGTSQRVAQVVANGPYFHFHRSMLESTQYASDWEIAEHVRHGAEPPLVMGARYQMRFVTSDACPAILA